MNLGLFKNLINETFWNHVFNIYVEKDLVLNNQGCWYIIKSKEANK